MAKRILYGWCSRHPVAEVEIERQRTSETSPGTLEYLTAIGPADLLCGVCNQARGIWVNAGWFEKPDDESLADMLALAEVARGNRIPQTVPPGMVEF